MSNHDAEQAAYVQRMLDHRAARLADATAAMQADLDRLRESWACGAYSVAGHEDRMQRMRDDTARYLKGLSCAADEPAPIDVAGGHRDRSGPSPASRQGPRQPDPHAAALAEAARLKSLSLTAYAEERQRLIRASTSARGLFS
jgi:hypothetical protein